MKKRVVSFSLWGDNPDYTIGAIRNAQLAQTVYPGWESWFYVASSVRDDVVRELEKEATRVIRYEDQPGSDGMFERFRPMADLEHVSMFVSRDCDSRLSDREYKAVIEWDESGKQFHAMRDHEAHGMPVMGGMWGAKTHGIINTKFMYEELLKYKNSLYNDDQKSLYSFYLGLSGLFHENDSLGRFNGKEFPAHDPVEFGSFVGERITFEDKVGRV